MSANLGRAGDLPRHGRPAASWRMTMETQQRPVSLLTAVQLGLQANIPANGPICNLYACIRDRLRAPDEKNQHDALHLEPVEADETSFTAVFRNPSDGAKYRVIVHRMNG